MTTSRTIRSLIRESHATAVAKGWWGKGGGTDRPVLEQLMLMVTELAEAAEEIRSGHSVGEIYYNYDRVVTDDEGNQLPKPEGFLAELADLYIRVGDTIGKYGLASEFEEVLAAKLSYNSHREYRHGGKTA